MAAWRAGRRAGGADTEVLAVVRERLDDDLDTPGAIAAIDDAAADGVDVSRAAQLLGVRLADN